MIMARNRGLFLEEWIEQANAVYENKGLAVIRKIPTPWKVQRKFQPYKRTYEIAYAYPEAKSTVDFGGTAKKFSIWFDAKVTEKKSYPLKNIHKHQVEYLQKVHEQGGKAFFLIHFSDSQKTWVLWLEQLICFVNSAERKSIPLAWIESNCDEVKSGNGVMLDYLPLVIAERS